MRSSAGKIYFFFTSCPKTIIFAFTNLLRDHRNFECLITTFHAATGWRIGVQRLPPKANLEGHMLPCTLRLGLCGFIYKLQRRRCSSLLPLVLACVQSIALRARAIDRFSCLRHQPTRALANQNAVSHLRQLGCLSGNHA